MSTTLPSSVPPAISLHALARRFARRWALRGVTLTVQPGEIVGVLGHNGSGKSTLLRVLATAIRPSLGSGSVFGFDLARDANMVRSVAGLLAHTPGLYDDLTATENLEFAATMLGLRGAPIAELLDRVGLGHEAHERVRGFSAGMQRRVALARLMLQRPRLLLLDEPYNSFDSEGVALVNSLVRETRDAGGSVLVVLHEVLPAQGLLDRSIAMRNGAVAHEHRSELAGGEWRSPTALAPSVAAGGG